MSDKKIYPRGDWVLVRPLDDQNGITNNGLLIPQTEEKEQKAQGIVVKVGEKVEDIPLGQTVVYGAFMGEVVKIMQDGVEVEYRVMKDEDIIAFVK